MKRRDKHSNTRVLSYSDFSGGENYLAPPSEIGDSELALARNFEFDRGTGHLHVRPGFRRVGELTESNLPGVCSVSSYFTSNFVELRVVSRKLYISTRDLSYSSPSQELEFVGSLSGVDQPMFCEWGQDPRKVLIASGGVLQVYDSSTKVLSDVDISNVKSENGDEVYALLSRVNIVFSSFGRIVVAQSGADTLFYSAIGDELSWAYDSGDISKGQSIDVGYKDGGDIVAIVPLSKDLIVFKTSGVFRVTGIAPNWSVYELSRVYRTVNRFSAIQLGNDCVFIDPSEGVCCLSAVEAYGDLKFAGFGEKINSALKSVLTSDSRLVHVRSRGQMWVVSPPQSVIYVFHYDIGKGAWTHYCLDLPGESTSGISSVSYDDNHGNVYLDYLYLRDGSQFTYRNYILDSSVSVDDVDSFLNAELRPKQLDLVDDTFVKRSEIVVLPRSACSSRFCLYPPEGKETELLVSVTDNYPDSASECSSLGCYCLDPAVPVSFERSFTGYNVSRGRSLSPRVVDSNGRYVVKEIRLWITEV